MVVGLVVACQVGVVQGVEVVVAGILVEVAYQ